MGNYGSNSDLGIFKHSAFGLKFMAQDLQIPGRKMLPGFPQAGLLPHCIVGDEAFPLRPDLMKPFPRGMRGNKLPEDQLVFRWFKFTLKAPYSIMHGKLRLAIWDTSFWTFWSNLDTRDLETYPRTYSGHF